MPQTRHIERHFTGSETLKDIVIGMADGLTVPFALAAQLSSPIETTGIIVTAGLARNRSWFNRDGAGRFPGREE